MIFVKIGCPDTSDFEVLLWYLPKAIRANRKLQVGVSSTTSHAFTVVYLSVPLLDSDQPRFVRGGRCEC